MYDTVCCDGPVAPSGPGPGMACLPDPVLIRKLDVARRALHDLEDYVQMKNDEANMKDKAAGMDRWLGWYALKEINSIRPAVPPDPTP